MMCKCYAHGITCTWTKKYGNCRQVHSEEVRDAHRYLCHCKANEQFPNAEEIKFILSRKGKLNDIQTKVNQKLFNMYPREPTKLEIEKAKEEDMKDQIIDAFQNMYGTNDEESKIQTDETK